MLEKYVQIKEKLQTLPTEIVAKEEVENVIKLIDDKLNNLKPTIMVYGTYNAGKSTLINALFGKEVAKTGDTPETKQIHTYTYNGYIIYDTPGLNANSADDMMANEQFNKSEVILFVLSSKGAFEEEYIYKAIIKTIKANKPIIVVINNKSGYDINSNEAQQIIQKVSTNIGKMAVNEGIKNFEKKVNICMVNALSAFKAKQENKKILLKKSNLPYLESLILEIMDKTGKKDIVNTLNQNILNFLNNLLERIDKKIDNEELKEVEELITFLIKEKESFAISLKNITTTKLNNIKNDLFVAIQHQNQEELQNILDNTINEISAQIEQKVNNTIDNIKIKINDFEANIERIFLQNNPSLLGIDFQNYEDESFNIPPEIKEKIKQVIQDRKLVKQGVEKALWLIKENFKELMRGKGKVWIEKAAGKVAVFLNIAMGLYESYSAYEEHQRKIQEEQNKILQIKSNIDQMIEDIKLSIFNEVDNISSTIFNGIIINFQETSKKLKKEKNNFINYKNDILQIKSLIN